MENHKIKVEDLIEWREDRSVTFAKSKIENKRLNCLLNGVLEVVVGNAIIWRGRDLDDAVEVYNKQTRKT